MSRKKQDDVETVHDKGEIEKALADTEAEAPDDATVAQRDLHRADELEGRVNHLEHLVAEKQEHIDTLVNQLAECQAEGQKRPRRKKGAARDAQGVHDFWDGYEQALKDKAFVTDGVAYVGRQGETLSQALHGAEQRRRAQVAEAEAR